MHVGFEALADLKQDLRAGFEVLLRGRVGHRVAASGNVRPVDHGS
ncbi:hypothetical protein ACFQ3Z_04165 [Streptomyces nogalater]